MKKWEVCAGNLYGKNLFVTQKGCTRMMTFVYVGTCSMYVNNKTCKLCSRLRKSSMMVVDTSGRRAPVGRA